MNVGTRSVLFGAHCFFIHPWFVAWAWWRLYGFPFDPRLWVAFFVHDLGYWGKPNMDGEEGEQHPYLGAKIMGWLFDRPRREETRQLDCTYWHDFSLLHSRFLANKLRKRCSNLCMADKLAIALTPSWLYIPMACATGEIHEYRKAARLMNPGSGADYATSHLDWHRSMQKYVAAWVEEHKDGRPDTWTTDRTKSADETGCYGGRPQSEA